MMSISGSEGWKDHSDMIWHGMVSCGVVSYVYGETILSALASCASLMAFMRGPFVLKRQAH